MASEAKQQKGKWSETKPHHHQNWHPYLSAFQRDGEKWAAGLDGDDDGAMSKTTEKKKIKQNKTILHLLTWSLAYACAMAWCKETEEEKERFLHLFLFGAYVTCISCIGWRYRIDAHRHRHRVKCMFHSFNLSLVCLDGITVSLFILRFLYPFSMAFPLQCILVSNCITFIIWCERNDGLSKCLIAESSVSFTQSTLLCVSTISWCVNQYFAGWNMAWLRLNSLLTVCQHEKWRKKDEFSGEANMFASCKSHVFKTHLNANFIGVSIPFAMS